MTNPLKIALEEASAPDLVKIGALRLVESLGLNVPEPVVAPWLDREPWLEARKLGIGSSEIWKLFSEDPNDRLSLYAEKIGEPLEPEPELNADMERGRLFEDVAARKYAEKTGRELVPIPLVRHPKIEVLFTDVDRIVLPNTGVGDYATKVAGAWEAKVPRYHVFSRYRRLGLPERIIWQAQHHLAVTGLDFCSFTAFHADSLSVLEWDLERNEAMIGRILEAVPRFWADHVEKRTPPPPPVDEAPKEKVDVSKVGGEVVVRTDPEWIEAAAEFAEAQPVYKEAEAARKAAVAKLRKLVGGVVGEYEGGGVTARLSETPGSAKWKDTVDRIADAWPLDSNEFKTLVRNGELRNEDGKTLSDNEVSNLMRVLALDPYALKVEGKPTTRFAPRILRESSDE